MDTARQEGERIRRRNAGSDEGGLLVAEVILEVLGHAEGLDLLAPEDGLHQLVRGEVLLVLRVLKSQLIRIVVNKYKQFIRKMEIFFSNKRWRHTGNYYHSNYAQLT